METVRTPDALLEYDIRGSGSPTTLFAHGLGGSIAETRPLGSGVEGTKAFCHLRGHGGSTSWTSGAWDYPALAGDLEAVASAVGATRFVGVSLGAGAALHLLAARPDRFERCVFFLPGSIDQPRPAPVVGRLSAIADAIDAGDRHVVAELLLLDVPAARRQTSAGRAYASSRAKSLVGTSVSRLFRALPSTMPVVDRSALRAVTAECLVIGQENDAVHPAELARELAAALGPSGSRCEIFDQDGAMWGARPALRQLVTTFLNPDPQFA